MTDFQPRFVDLVRSYTTTVGTGAFALGPAVNGFTGFGSALQSGDSFYYSAIGVDKPAEREVGRGTLQANGTISRQALGGPLTNFSSGTKSIALIAAAEWFNLVQSGAGSQLVVAATRSALAASQLGPVLGLLTESGCEGMFVFDGSDLSAKVAADPRQGLYVAPASDPTGVSGAWVRKFDGAIKGAWFRIAGDGTTNDGPAVAAAVTAALAHGGADIFGHGTAAPTLELPFARNAIKMGTATLTLTKAIRIVGHSGGTFGGAATALKWDSGVNGIEVRAANVYLDGLSLKGGWLAGATSEGECHAIKAYAKFGYGQLYICDWQGDGIHVNVTAGSGGDTEGNANGLYGGSLTVNSCRVGLSLAGADCNGGFFGLIDANYNRQAGVMDATAFGNGYGAIQTSGNGVQGIAGTTPSCAFNNGHIYYVASGQAAAASTAAPPSTATGNAQWLYWKDAGAATPYAPQWVSGMTWREGGPIYVTALSASNSSTFDHLYAEADQAPVQLGQASVVRGGLIANGVAPGTRRIFQTSDGVNIGPKLRVRGDFAVQDPGSIVALGPNTGANDGVTYFDNTNAFHWHYYRNNNAIFGWKISGHSLGMRWNVAAGLSHEWRVNDAAIAVITNNGLAVTGTLAATNLSGANTGDETSGSILSKLSATNIATSGSIKSSGATAGIGYSTGAGGTITQTTSKSTGVTLNKASGQITTHNAALAAAALVSFAVTNSSVAATDTINLNLASGNATAGTYRYWVEGIGAGSFKIVIENRSGGSLSEALVFDFAVIKAVAA